MKRRAHSPALSRSRAASPQTRATRSWRGRPRGFAFPLLLLTLLLTAGCAGYRLGPTQGRQAGAQSVMVLPFHNQTLEPRLADPLTASLRKELQRDGTFRLETRDGGDIIVSGTIVHYNRRGIAFQRRETRTAKDYIISMTAQVTATERLTGRVLLDKRISGQSMIRVGNDLTSAERQGIPLVADDFARNVTSLLANGDW